jgi:hypothetical protein
VRPAASGARGSARRVGTDGAAAGAEIENACCIDDAAGATLRASIVDTAYMTVKNANISVMKSA